MAEFEMDFLAEGLTTSFGSGKVAGEPELRVRGQRIGEETSLKMVVLNRRLEPHSASLKVVCGMIWVCWTSTAGSNSLSLPTICSTGSKLKKGSSNTSFKPTAQPPSGPDSITIRSYGTNFQPKMGAHRPDPSPLFASPSASRTQNSRANRQRRQRIKAHTYCGCRRS